MLRKLDPVLFALDRRWFFAAGSAVLSSNLIVNTFVLERFFAPDGHFVSRTKWLIAGYNLFSLVLAAALAFAALRLRGFRREVKLHHVLLALLGAEAFLRLTIFTDVLRIPPLENPRLYFLGSCGDPVDCPLPLDGISPDSMRPSEDGAVAGAGVSVGRELLQVSGASQLTQMPNQCVHLAFGAANA